MDMTMLIIWLVVVIILAAVEVATIQLVAIWFAIGGVGAMVACSFRAPLWVQLLVFAIVSFALLLVTRPFVKRFMKNKPERTNADRLIGKTAVVTEDIDNLKEHGAVKISGVTWTARSTDGSGIAEGEKVVIERIESVKLIVTALH